MEHKATSLISVYSAFNASAAHTRSMLSCRGVLTFAYVVGALVVSSRFCRPGVSRLELPDPNVCSYMCGASDPYGLCRTV